MRTWRNCACCGRDPQVRDNTDLDPTYVALAIPDFCMACNDNRCDAYPDTCPNAYRKPYPNSPVGKDVLKAFAWFVAGVAIIGAIGMVCALAIAVALDYAWRLWHK